MKRCPHCGCDLTSSVVSKVRSSPRWPGPPSAGKLVDCPECENTIDGFATL